MPWGPDGRLSNVTRRNKIYTFQMRLDDIEKYSSGKKILDIGCAMGLFLEAAQMRGWDPYGIEVSEYAA
ncbi:MAG: class I SAM-dependent methyltransferase, partial [Candidatus Omnitrophota bacterium]